MFLLSLLIAPPLKVFTDTTAHLHITSTPPDYRAARSQLIISQKVLAENECVMSDLRDVMSVWCAEGQSRSSLQTSCIPTLDARYDTDN